MLKHVFDAVAVLCLGGGLMVAGGAADAPALGLGEALAWMGLGSAATAAGFAVVILRDRLWRY